MRKINLLLNITILFPICLRAQLNFVFPVGTAKGGAITAQANDWEVIGVSPSNLGWESNDRISFTILNIGISAQADQLTLPNVEKIISGKDTNMLERIASSHSGLNIYGNFIWAAFSIKIPKIGGLALSISDRAFGNITMSPNITSSSQFQTAFAAIASTAFTSQNAQKFNGQVNINTADSLQMLVNTLNSFSGSYVSMYEFREINVDYGRELFKIGSDDSTAFKFYGGVGLKYLIGLADIHGQFVNGTVTADYAIENNPIYSPIPSNAPGQGYGIDIGTSMVYKKWKFAVAVTDIGSINWTGTHATLNDTIVAERIITDRSDSSNSSNVKNYIQTNGEKFTTILPSKFRLGASYKVNNLLTVASDVIMPLNNAVGNLIGTYYSIAGHLTLFKALVLDAGFATAKNYGVVMPMGIAFGHKVQIYFGVNDVLTYFGKTTNTDLSAAVGLIRVNL
jgi:hypothetical protein